jgi:Tfp pilus assembly protein PilO
MDVFKKQLFVQLGIAFGIMALLIAVNQFMANTLARTAVKIQNQKNDLNFRTRVTDSLAALKSDFEKARPLFAILNSVLPQKDELINLGKDLGALAKQNNIDMGFTFGGESPPTDETPGFIRFTITGDTTYSNFLKFLKDIEKMRIFVKFNSLDMTRKGNNSFNFIAGGQVFYQ